MTALSGALSGAFTEILADVGRHLAHVQKGHESEVAYLRDQVRELEDQVRAGSTLDAQLIREHIVISCEAPAVQPGSSFETQLILERPKEMQLKDTATTKSTCVGNSTTTTKRSTSTNSTKSLKIMRQTTSELNIRRQATSQETTRQETGLAEIPVHVEDDSPAALAHTVTAVPEGSLGKVPQIDCRPSVTHMHMLAGREHLVAQLESPKAEIFACSVIVLNTFLMALEFQYKGVHMAYTRGIAGYESKQDWPHADEAFVVLEWVFIIFFTIELFIRIVVIQCPFFRQAMNWVDIIVVAISWIPMDGIINPTMVRLLRLARLSRILRMFKFSSILYCLHLILKSIASSANVLFWSVLLLMVIQMIASMFVGQMLATWLDDPNTETVAREAVFTYYGTFTKTFFTMFEVTLANWAAPARVLTNNVSESWALYFIVYRCLIGFGVLSVISAIFVQQTLKVAQSDEEIMISQKMAATADFSRKLQNLFEDIDSSGDGVISRSEFEVIMADSQTKAFMQSLEIDVNDLERLYNMLDNGDGEISTDEFAAGIARTKGPAKNIDLLEVLSKVGRMEVQMNEVRMMAREQLAASKVAEDAVDQCGSVKKVEV